MTIDIYTYSAKYKDQWDSFVTKSKNGTFLFYRDFIEYHGNRFVDCSLLFYSEDILLGVMPGNISNNVYYTYQGLTYGGLVMGEQTTMSQVLLIFDALIAYLKQKNIEKIVYKAIPHIYHKYPSEEDLYALFQHRAALVQRNISSTVQLANRISYSKTRNRGVKKATESALKVSLSDDLSAFWKLLTYNLYTRYDVAPVHTLDEISGLKAKFPNQIRLYVAQNEKKEIMGGCLTFETDTLIHAQYTVATEEGRKQGAVDIVIDYIMNRAASDCLFFDYGISTEDGGRKLNEALIYQKEGFGARGIVYDIYEISVI